MSTLDRKYLTIKEAMEAYHVGYQTLYLAVKRGEIDAWKPGKTMLLDEVSCDSWFETKKIRPKKPVGRPRKGAPRL